MTIPPFHSPLYTLLVLLEIIIHSPRGRQKKMLFFGFGYTKCCVRALRCGAEFACQATKEKCIVHIRCCQTLHGFSFHLENDNCTKEPVAVAAAEPVAALRTHENFMNIKQESKATTTAPSPPSSSQIRKGFRMYSSLRYERKTA